MSSRTRLYGVTYVKLKDNASVIGANGEEEYKILKFSAYYETAKFNKGSIGLVRQIKVRGILKYGTNHIL
jgi:hypothetical protein